MTGWIYASGPGMFNVNIYNNLLTASGESYPSNGYIALREVFGANVYNNTVVGSGKGNRSIFMGRQQGRQCPK